MSIRDPAQTNLETIREKVRSLVAEGQAGPDSAALNRVVREAKKRAGSLRGLIRNLSLRKRYDFSVVDTVRLAEEAEKGRVPDCSHCGDRCCARPENLVVLRLSDAARLADAGLEWAIETSHQRFSEAARTSHPEVAEMEALDSVRSFPWLARRHDGACVFLDADGRCAIYEIRPLGCRRFPFRVDDRGSEVVVSSACQSFRDAEGSEAADQLAAAAVAYNEKLRDLLTLHHAKEALKDEGLSRFLPIIDE